MDMHILQSKCDGLSLEVAVTEPQGEIKGIVQFSHGMAEYKERYGDFMRYLSDRGYVCVIHDHRGHGASVKNIGDLGYFYTEDADYIVEDLYQVTCFIKEKYPNFSVILFSHSMGTLVARNYLKKYDTAIDKLILCGPPTQNPLASVGVFIANLTKFFKGDRYRSPMLQKLTFGTYNKGFRLENGWICTDEDEVRKYNNSALCGYVFTTNGFINLYKLMRNAFCKTGWMLGNPQLPIFMIAGSDDPVIQSEQKFRALSDFLRLRGYTTISCKLYPGKRHELLNEHGKMEIYQDVLNFIQQ